MITIPVSVVVSGQAPITYVWEVTYNVASYEGCVEFDDTNGVIIRSPHRLQNEITFETEACLENTTIYVVATDADGCISNIEVEIENPCDNFVVNPITRSQPFIFTTLASNPGCTTFNYIWSYPTNLFAPSPNQGDLNNPVISLDLITSSVPASAVISVTVTDCNGCEETQYITINFCQPIAYYQLVNLVCEFEPPTTVYTCTDVYSQSGIVYLSAGENCPYVELDWTTLNYTTTEPGLCIYQFPGLGRLVITADATVVPGIYQIYWSVADQYGIRSTTGTIDVVVPNCGTRNPFVIPNVIFQVACTPDLLEDCDGDLANDEIFYLGPLETYLTIPIGTTIDWSCTVISPDPPLDGNTWPVSRSNCNIELYVDMQGYHYFKYAKPVTPPFSDVFAFQLCTDYGSNCSECSTGTIATVLLECALAPSVSNTNVCVSCDSSVVIDITTLVNPNGGILNCSSLNIDPPPASGYVLINGCNVIYYPNPGFTGNDSFGYTIANHNPPTPSNTGYVFISVLCAGESANTELCA